MSDHIWEDYVEPGFQSAKWVLEMLHTELVTLDDDECGHHGEFSEAAIQIAELVNKIITIRDQCQDTREL